MKYFYNKQIIEIELPKQGYKVGTDINEQNAFVKLTANQIAFLGANENASVMEVYNCKLNEVIESTPIKPFFDDRAAYNRMLYYFKSEHRAHVVALYSGVLLKMLENRAFSYIKSFLIDDLMAANCITQSDFDLVNLALRSQGIDLNDETTFKNVI